MWECVYVSSHFVYLSILVYDLKPHCFFKGSQASEIFINNGDIEASL